MHWTQITIDVPDDLIDSVVGELSTHGAAGVWESPAAEPGFTQLAVYFNRRPDLETIERLIHSIFQRSDRKPPSISRGIVEEADWTGEWRKSYTCFPVADSFYVIPSWEDPVCPEDRLPIRIDPGQAFGTGTHETTQMTLGALERWVEPNQIVLDVGTGSGILAIASRLLGATRIFACDIDPVAMQVARANIERNSGDHVHMFCGSLDAVRSDSVQFLLGNLTADVIMDLFPEFARVLQPHGIAVFSGILRDQEEDVRTILDVHSFNVFEEITQGEWIALICAKHGG